jgi:hypothetical protein
MRTTAAVSAGLLLFAGGATAQQGFPTGEPPGWQPPPETAPGGDLRATPAPATGQSLYAVGVDAGFTGITSFLYRIDDYGSHPRAHFIGQTFEDLLDLAIDPTTGRFYGLGATGHLFELDPATAAATSRGATGQRDLNAFAFDVDGNAWAWSSSNGNLVRIDKEDGAATLVGPTGFLSGGDLAFDAGGTLYGTTRTQLLRIDKETGAATLVGPLGFSGAFGLDIDSDGTMYLGRGDDYSGLAELYRVDKNTGATTFIGSVAGASQVGLAGLAFTSASAATALHLRDGRFRVEATWRLTDGSNGPGKGIPLTAETGYFWFFQSSNVEFVVKILDGCAVNGRYWVFAGGLTNVSTEIRVTDTATDTTKTYRNPQGEAFQPIQDTDAFATCPKPEEARGNDPPAHPAGERWGGEESPAAAMR